MVLESTTYPGTTQEIIVETINRVGRERGVQVLEASSDESDRRLNGVMVAFSPEREDPGNMITPRREVPKVIGGVDARASAAAAALYGAVFQKTVLMSSPAAAEMTKLLENIYRSVNIALVNELKQLCEHMHIDIWEVIGAAATKPFGFQAFYPGPGVGGHCIPVDPFYLSWRAKKFGFSTRFIELAGEVNESMPGYVVDRTAGCLAEQGIDVSEAKVLVLGVSYKPDVDDLRESPSLAIIELLRKRGASVAYNDPFFPSIGQGRKYALNLESTVVSEDGHEVAGFDCVIIATDHSTYNVAAIVEQARLVIDTRNAARDVSSSKVVRC